MTYPIPPILKQRATVYVENPATERYDLVHKANLHCWVTYSAAARTGPVRVEFVENRQLLWDPNYVMPDDPRIDIEGELWNVDRGSYYELRSPRNDIIMRRANIRKATE